MRNALIVMFVLICFGLMSTPAHAAKPGKVVKATKERLVLMPLRLAEEDKSLQGAMETALVQGLQQKYEVFSGEQVAQKAREIFMKESRNTAKKECDETRCMQGIAESFQAELIATANVTKREDGYFLALSIQNIFDNLVVFSNSVPCEGCNAYQVVDRLKEMSGFSAPMVTSAADNNEPRVVPSESPVDPETALWNEVKISNLIDDYQTFLIQYPKGRYMALAKARLNNLKVQEAAAAKKMREETTNEATRREQLAWQAAEQTGGIGNYKRYLEDYPQGSHAVLAQTRIKKLKIGQDNDVAAQLKAVAIDKIEVEITLEMLRDFRDQTNLMAGKAKELDLTGQYITSAQNDASQNNVRNDSGSADSALIKRLETEWNQARANLETLHRLDRNTPGEISQERMRTAENQNKEAFRALNEVTKGDRTKINTLILEADAKYNDFLQLRKSFERDMDRVVDVQLQRLRRDLKLDKGESQLSKEVEVTEKISCGDNPIPVCKERSKKAAELKALEIGSEAFINLLMEAKKRKFSQEESRKVQVILANEEFRNQHMVGEAEYESTLKTSVVQDDSIQNLLREKMADQIRSKVYSKVGGRVDYSHVKHPFPQSAYERK